MNENEKVGWLGIGLGTIVTLLPFIMGLSNGNNFNEGVFAVSILGVIMCILGASKAFPEILISTYNEIQKTDKKSDWTSKQPFRQGETQ